jgi:hypothetical protein
MDDNSSLIDRAAFLLLTLWSDIGAVREIRAVARNTSTKLSAVLGKLLNRQVLQKSLGRTFSAISLYLPVGGILLYPS